MSHHASTTGRPVVQEGTLTGGLPYLSAGAGPPLLMVPGLTMDNTNPTGWDRRFQLRAMGGLADRFSVYLVNRRPGLAVGTTMSDLANDYAAAIRSRFGGPVAVYGVSTGGSVGLQLAADHPELVERLAVAAAACRLSEEGRKVQRRFGELLGRGRERQAWALFASSLFSSRVAAAAVGGVASLLGPFLSPEDPADVMRTIDAEDRYDISHRLADISAPTLIVGGVEDPLYPPDLVALTAEGIAGSRLVVLAGAGHIAASGSHRSRREVRTFLVEPSP